MPTYQLVLHLNDHRLRTGFLDRAPHGHYKSCVPDHFKRGSLGWLEETSFQRSSIPRTTIGLILAEGIVPALSALSPYFLAKASDTWLRPAFSIQTNSTGPLANPGLLEESEDESGT